MPGVDFDVVRSGVSMRQVLEWLSFEPRSSRVDQWRGPCPIHRSQNEHSQSFSVNLASQRYQCFHCGSFGNQIELWAAVHGMTAF
jgi:DNA primase